jgi:hypothetical protein
MAQQDKKHIGDIQNSQWWGAKQGLFINALANQYGSFEADVTFQNTINQNTIFTIESTNFGTCTFGNTFLGTINQSTGISFINGDDFIPNLQRFGLSFIKQILFVYSKQTAMGFNNENVPNQMFYHSINWDGSIFYSQNPPTFDAFNAFKQRIKNYSRVFDNFGGGISPLYILSTDNLYPTGSTTMRLNYISETTSNNFNTGVIRDFRIYTRVLQSKEVTDNYHAMAATDTSNLFIEYKMSQTSDFYTYFDGVTTKLYAKNTGSSGNILNNGTGYDMQLIGYVGNIPILQSIY